MAYIDGLGNGTMPAMNAVAYGSKFTPSTYYVDLISPEQGDTVATLTPTFRVLTSGDPTPYSIQFDVATDAAFSNIVWTTTLTGQVDGFNQATVPGSTLNDGTQYFWRVKAGTGSFSTTYVVYINTLSGPGVVEVYSNIGVDYPADVNIYGMHWMYYNVGVYWPEVNIYGMHQMYENIGFFFDEEPVGAHQMYENINEDTPTPFIWLLVPDSARPGEGVKVFGHGFGSTQVEYNGIVEAKVADDEWVPVQVVNWVMYPPTANAYNELRVINPQTGQIDWQHGVIEILVETWMVPLGYFLRVRTDGA